MRTPVAQLASPGCVPYAPGCAQGAPPCPTLHPPDAHRAHPGAPPPQPPTRPAALPPSDGNASGPPSISSLSNSEKPTRPAFPATRLAEILLAAPIQPACQPPGSPSYEPISHYATSVPPKASEMAAGASRMLSLHVPQAQRDYSRGQRSLPGGCSPPSTPPVGLHQALHAGSQRSGHPSPSFQIRRHTLRRGAEHPTPMAVAKVALRQTFHAHPARGKQKQPAPTKTTENHTPCLPSPSLPTSESRA